jgi:hypothetical protein
MRLGEIALARVLFVAPTAPAPERNGLAMRAAVSVEGLDQHHDLTVAVVRSSYDEGGLGWVQDHAPTVIEVPFVPDRRSALSWLESARGRSVAAHPLPELARYRPPVLGERIIEAVGDAFDVLVVMRTYLAGAVIPLLDAGIPGILDADDDDARACESLGRLDPSFADEVPLYERFQSAVFSWFERVLFASVDDAVPPFGHLPNAISIPEAWSLRPFEPPLELLYVGNPGYLPNRDALDRLEHGVVPAIENLGLAVRVLHPGPDEDTAPYYRRAHIAAVPLRAGGGTRIKLLEAFAHGCPVVATPTGARGLSVRSGRQLVITAEDDDAAGFASAVVDLAGDGRRREALAGAARSYVVAHHDRIRTGAALAALVDEVAGARPAAPG